MENRQPLISVITPYYSGSGSAAERAKQALPYALCSLLLQTHPNWECLLIDDGSPEAPDAIVARVDDPRIRVVRLERNRGRGAARQKGLELSAGEYICMLDADDWYYSSRLQRLLAFLKKNPEIALVSSGMAVTGPGDSASPSLKGLRRAPPGVFPPLGFPHRPPVFFAPSMIRASAAREARFDPEFAASEDFDYLLTLLLKHPSAVISDCGYVYSESQTISLGKIRERISMNRKTFAKYLGAHPLRARWEMFKLAQRELAYRATYATGLGAGFYARALVAPGPGEAAEFEDARARVARAVKERFGA